MSGTNTAYQAKSVLRMLTAMVTLGPTQAREVLLKVNWDKRSSKKDPPDVRTCFIHFLLTVLFEPSPLVLKDFFSLKTRLSSQFPGLMQDQAETVMLVVETFRSKVLENPAVSKTQKMKVFGSHNIKTILALLNWTGTKKSDASKGNVEEKEAVQECHSFRKGVTGKHKARRGISSKTGRGNYLKLKVNFLPEIIQLSKEVRNLKNLGFRVPLAIVNKAHQANQLYPFAMLILIVNVRTYERSL